MTECERIIEQGILPKTFFEPEILCDFYVDEKRKKIWAIELDLMLAFDEFCRKNKLKYYLSVGTLLGAIRHKGFIPWDDDVDVEMPREDYERLQNLGSEFEDPYFLQTPYTDPYYAFSHIRLINKNTTCFTKLFAYQPMKHGVYLDIFPLDSWDGKDMVANLMIDALNKHNSTYMRALNPKLDKNNRDRLCNTLKVDHIQVYEEIQKIATRHNNKNTNYLIRAVRSVYDYSKYHFLKSDYAETSDGIFEGYHFPIPIGYESILNIQFGNYMRYPLAEKRGNHHKGFIIEPDLPYSQYMNRYIKEGE